MPLSKLRLHSEPYAATGNIGDSGFRKLLGAPSLDLIQTVIREAIQNSCDADKTGRGPEIRIRLRTLNEREAQVVRQNVLVELPFEPTSAEKLTRFRDGAALQVLEICDFNTTGLGGPTRADRLPRGATSTDFIDFLRNVGTSRDTDLGGGTYGFGKVSLYLASKCQTILVDTRTDENSGSQRRFMGCHLGPAADVELADGSCARLTGRHWWGHREADEEPADPLVDEQAGQLADALGFLPRDLGRSGTSIMILDPELGEGGLEAATGRIAETLLWNFWPRMMRTCPNGKRLNIQLELNGDMVAIPDPEEFPPLDLFCDAMNRIRDGHDRVTMLECRRPVKELGRLSIVRGLRARRTPLVEDGESLFPQQSAHIAVMRPVELVVRYYEGDPLSDASAEWAGVFVASEEKQVERAFADAEPPAHDDWQFQNMPSGHARTFVKRAVEQIRKAAKEVAAPGIGPTPTSEGKQQLAAVAARLGGLLAGDAGNGARPPRAGGGGGASRKRRASAPEFVGLEFVDGQKVAVFQSEITGEGPQTYLRATPRIMIDGGTSKADLAEGERAPTVLRISMKTTDLAARGSVAEIGDAQGVAEIRVRMPDDCAVGLSLAMETAGETS
ncbi:MAG: hypothetical protein ACX94D_14625 [Henriciella sp.]